MVAFRRIITEPPVQWVTSAPFWELNAASNGAFRQPEILRFDSDSFMEQFIALATGQPHRLAEWRTPADETWRKPPPQPQVNGDPINVPALADGVKLFQPAHERYYLVTASLVCRIPGLPDKMLDFTKAEKSSFVMRRLMRRQNNTPVDPSNPNTYHEYAFVNNTWQRVPASLVRTLRKGEEVNPMFETHTSTLEGVKRRLFAGLVPVAKHDAYLHAPKAAAPDDTEHDTLPPPDPRLIQLEMDVLSPWREVKRVSRRAAQLVMDNIVEDNGTLHDDLGDFFGDIKQFAREQRDQLQVSSWYVLLDFASFLKDHLPDVWEDLDSSTSDLSGAKRTLWNRLRTIRFYRFDNDNNTRSEWEDIWDDHRDDDSDYTYTYIEEFLHDIDGRVAFADAVLLAEVLRDLDNASVRSGLEDIQVDYPVPPGYADTPQWPGADQQGLLSDPGFSGSSTSRRLKHLVPFDPSEESSTFTSLETLITNALGNSPVTAPTPAIPIAASLAKSFDADQGKTNEEGLFVIRCVYDRPNCPPELQRTITSEPTVAFRMAPYFDPDAPARPIKITMPVDTTPAGLRKFAKNTAFVMSDTLACQFEQMQSLGFVDLVLSVLPWPLNKSLPNVGAAECKSSGINIGKICSFSIPIITICALILMLIIVFLLDIIFKWVPYLFLCFPIPGLKSKE